MLIWINGAFGAGKTTTAYELRRRLPEAYVYDPENIGYFLRRNTPPQCHTPDFQDMPLWRRFNYETLRLIADAYAAPVIVPMTLVSPAYYEEIIGRLRSEGVDVRNMVLCASRETILKRLRARNLRPSMMVGSVMKKESFAVSAIPRCLDFFDNYITEGKLPTDHMTVDEVVEAIAASCGLPLLPESRSALKKTADRLGVLLEHIRR